MRILSRNILVRDAHRAGRQGLANLAHQAAWGEHSIDKIAKK